jgi:hypothetical protein
MVIRRGERLKKMMIPVIFVGTLGLAACSDSGTEEPQPEQDTNQDEVQQEKTTSVDTTDGEAVIQYFEENGAEFLDVKHYTAEDDPNEMLGRPGGYIAKVDFILPEVQQKKIDEETAFYEEIETEMTPEEIEAEVTEELSGFGVENGGSIELFEKPEEAQQRMEYVSSVAPSVGVHEYGFTVDNVYLRVSESLTPDEAAKYEEILNGLKEE